MNYMINVNKIFKENITFVEYSRSGIVYYTDDLEVLNELKILGWKYNECSKGYRVIPPSVSLCDITELRKVFQYQNIILNFAYFLYLKKLSKENKLNDLIKFVISKKNIFYKNFEFHISSGPIIETEIKIEGIDNRINQLKIDLLITFLESKEYDAFYNYALKKLNKNNIHMVEHFDIENLSNNVKNFYNHLIDLNKNINKKFKLSEKKYNLNIDIFYKIKYDVLLFIPNGCYKFLNLFVNEDNYDKVMFWEFHIDDTKPTTHKIFNKDLKNKKVLIIDSVYSGKTLLKLKKLIKEKGGYPILLGLYPKSRSVINILDYAVILDKLYSRKDLDLKDVNMYEILYIDRLKGFGGKRCKKISK